MEVYIKELICSSILELKLQDFKKEAFDLGVIEILQKFYVPWEKKKKEKERKKVSKISPALNGLLTSRKLGGR